MKLKFADDYPGDDYAGANGEERFYFERAKAPFVVSDAVGQNLLKQQWRKRLTEPGATPDAEPITRYEWVPCFVQVPDDGAPNPEQLPDEAAPARRRG